MERKLDQTSLFGGIVVSLTPIVTNLIHQCDPWRIWLAVGFENFQGMIAIHEVSQFPESKNNLLRETAVNYPGIGPSTQRSVVEDQVTTNYATRAVIQDNTRERNRQIIVFTPIIWIASFVYSFNLEYRAKFAESAINQGFVPTLFVEQYKRVRQVLSPIYRITTGLFRLSIRALIQLNPQLQGTFWDPDFLLTDAGLAQFMVFLEFLRNSEGNYIPFTACTASTLPPFDGGSFLTFGAYTVNRSCNFMLDFCYVISHSLNFIHAPHVGDAILGQLTYVNQNTGLPYTDHYATSAQCEIRSSYMSWASYLVARVTGKQPNDRTRSVRRTESSKQTTSAPPSDQKSSSDRKVSSRSPQRENSEFAEFTKFMFDMFKQFKRSNEKRVSNYAYSMAG